MAYLNTCVQTEGGGMQALPQWVKFESIDGLPLVIEGRFCGDGKWQYSLDTIKWTDLFINDSDTISLNESSYVYIRGVDGTTLYSSNEGPSCLRVRVASLQGYNAVGLDIKISGNLNALVHYTYDESFEPPDYCFAELFSASLTNLAHIVDLSELILPSKNVNNTKVYSGLFTGQWNLQSLPQVKAEIDNSNIFAFSHMFNGISILFNKNLGYKKKKLNFSSAAIQALKEQDVEFFSAYDLDYIELEGDNYYTLPTDMVQFPLDVNTIVFPYQECFNVTISLIEPTKVIYDELTIVQVQLYQVISGNVYMIVTLLNGDTYKVTSNNINTFLSTDSNKVQNIVTGKLDFSSLGYKFCGVYEIRSRMS